MPFLAMNAGALLLALGLIGFFAPHLIGTGEPYAKTALIPAGFGLLLEVCGAISLSKPGQRKFVMHLAAMVGLLGTVGGFVPLFRSGFDFGKASTLVGLGMAVVCLLFTLLCVRSFIAARRARKAALAQ